MKSETIRFKLAAGTIRPCRFRVLVGLDEKWRIAAWPRGSVVDGWFDASRGNLGLNYLTATGVPTWEAGEVEEIEGTEAAAG